MRWSGGIASDDVAGSDDCKVAEAVEGVEDGDLRMKGEKEGGTEGRREHASECAKIWSSTLISARG